MPRKSHDDLEGGGARRRRRGRGAWRSCTGVAGIRRIDIAGHRLDKPNERLGVRVTLIHTVIHGLDTVIHRP